MMESTGEEQIVIIDDSFQDDNNLTGACDLEATGDVYSQGSSSSKQLSELACSSQNSQNSRSDVIEMSDLPTSQESPFLNPTNIFKSTPNWKDHKSILSPKGIKRRLHRIQHVESHYDQPRQIHHYNPTSSTSCHNSLDEHTYARKVIPSQMQPSKKHRISSMSDSEHCLEEEGLQKMQIELSGLYTVLYSASKKQVVSLSLDQLYNFCESFQQSSLSSGRLADDSDSSHHDSESGFIKRNAVNSSTASSSTGHSSGSSSNNKIDGNSRGFSKQLILTNLTKLKDGCVCNPCMCNVMFDMNHSFHHTPAKYGHQQHLPQPYSSLEIMKNSPGVDLVTTGGGVSSSDDLKTDYNIVSSTSNSDENSNQVHTKVSLPKSPFFVTKAEGNLSQKKLVRVPLNPSTTVRLKSRTTRTKEIKPKNIQQEVKISIEEFTEELKKEVTPVDDDVNNRLQCPSTCKFNKDLFVYAKWPADKVFYPAIVKNCFYSDWEYSINLTVEFFDGVKLKLSSCNIFPASLLVNDTMITYKSSKDDNYILGIIQNVERIHPIESGKETCLSFTVLCDESDNSHYNKLVDVPFTNTSLNENCYRKLKKQIGENTITPHKFSKNVVDVCQDNLIEGKRKRRVADIVTQLSLPDSSVKKKDNQQVILRLHTLPSRRRKIQKETVDSSEAEEKKNQLEVIQESTSNKDIFISKITTSTTSTSAPEKIKKTRSTVRSEEMISSTSSLVAEPNPLITTEKRKRKPIEPYSPPESKPTTSKRLKRAQKESESTSSKTRTLVGKSRSRKIDQSSIASTSITKKPTAVRELIFRHDVVDTMEQTDSEPDDDTLSPDFDITSIGGGDIDYECNSLTSTSRKSFGNRIVKSSSGKSSTVAKDDEKLADMCGPIPNSPLFAGYHFIITHAGPESHYRSNQNRNKYESQDSDMSTDIESKYSSSCMFDYERIKNQILCGKGKLHNNLLSIPKAELSKTVVICDFICQTANYLLAATLNVPVYSHQLIITSCKKNVHIEEIFATENPLPFGITCDKLVHSYSKKRKVEPLKDYEVVLCATESNPRIKFWSKLIQLAGARLFYFTPQRNLISNWLSCANIVIVDDYCCPILVENSKELNIPMVSTRWLVDTIIRGQKKIMLPTDMVEYHIDNVISSQKSFGEDCQLE